MIQFINIPSPYYTDFSNIILCSQYFCIETENKTYYAQSSRTLSASFVLVDSNAATLSSTTAGCTVYNGATSCSVTAPTLTPKSGYTVDGWSTTNGGTTTTTTFTSGHTYYSVTHRTSALVATFNKTGVTTIGKESDSCYLYNGATSCSVSAPSIVRSGFTRNNLYFFISSSDNINILSST